MKMIDLKTSIWIQDALANYQKSLKEQNTPNISFVDEMTKTSTEKVLELTKKTR